MSEVNQAAINTAETLGKNINSEDWAARASQTVVQSVGTVRDKTTGPAILASRYAVYFLAVGLIAVIILVLLLILMIRGIVVLTGLLPFINPGETWLAYLILGSIFVGIGSLLWRKKEYS